MKTSSSRFRLGVMLCGLTLATFVAFFKVEGPVTAEINKKKRSFFAFSRAAFGIVKMRTDGERLFIYTNSGQADLKEAYAYKMNDKGEPEPVEVRKA